jgi:hypothetical protein
MIRLKKGTVIYGVDRYHGIQQLTISYTTPKQAVVKFDTYDVRFKKEIDCEPFRRIGAPSFESRQYWIETEIIKARYEYQELMRKFKAIIPDKLSASQLKEILDIAEKKRNQVCEILNQDKGKQNE